MSLINSYLIFISSVFDFDTNMNLGELGAQKREQVTAHVKELQDKLSALLSGLE